METKEGSFIDRTVCGECVNYIKWVVLNYEKGYEDNYREIQEELLTLENKINDEDLYLGVVGSFSSGKSTFINSVIHKNLLPTDAVQGTTVTASILKKAEYDDLEIVYNGGYSVKFSEAREDMLHDYAIETNVGTNGEGTRDKKSLLRRFIDWIKKLLGVSEKASLHDQTAEIDTMIQLFKKIISTEEVAIDIKYATLYYSNVSMPYKIAMVDTPGTESLNKRHNEVTKNAIDNICDAIVVIIPYDEPVSEDLLDYVNANLQEHKDNCIFVVTKIELLGDKEELPRLLRVIKKRLENGLGIESPCVVPMPTLLYLKNVDLEMTTTFLDDIPEEEKTQLLVLYDEGLSTINNILSEKRREFINAKIISICERICTKLSENLNLVIDAYDARNKILEENDVEDLDAFAGKINEKVASAISAYDRRNESELAFVTMEFSGLLDEITRSIGTSGDTKQLIYALNHSCSPCLTLVFSKMGMYLDRIIQECNQHLADMEAEYKKSYQNCGGSLKGHIVQLNGYVPSTTIRDFVNEKESEFQSHILNVKYILENETSGFLKKVKSFFSNPIQKHKELAARELSETLGGIRADTIEYAVRETQMYIRNIQNVMRQRIEEMIAVDRDTIERYRAGTKAEMDTNLRGRANTQECIDRLEQYITTIKEAG